QRLDRAVYPINDPPCVVEAMFRASTVHRLSPFSRSFASAVHKCGNISSYRVSGYMGRKRGDFEWHLLPCGSEPLLCSRHEFGPVVPRVYLNPGTQRKGRNLI